MSNLMLSQLVCTRIIHDLVGNAGALSNSLELMEEENDAEILHDLKNIITSSSKVLSARMKFFRLAFGLDNSYIKDDKTVFSAIDDYLKTLGSMSNNFSFAAEKTLPEHNRVIMLAVMILADLALKGGEIRTCYENECLWVAISSDSRFSESKIDNTKSVIAGSEDHNNDAQCAHILYLRELLKNNGKMSLFENGSETVVFNIKFLKTA